MDADTVWAYLGEFRDKSSLCAAIAELTAAGYSRWDAFSPYPLEAYAPLSGEREPKVARWTLGGGVAGFVGAYVMQWYAAVRSYPLLVGDKPLNSVPAFFVICFEVTILIAALSTLTGLFWELRLPTYYHPLFNVDAFRKASRDGFFLCIEARDPQFAGSATAHWLTAAGATHVYPVPP